MRKINLKIPAAVCVFIITLAVPAGAVTHYVSSSPAVSNCTFINNTVTGVFPAGENVTYDDSLNISRWWVN